MSALPSVAHNLKLYGKVTARGEGAVPFAAVGVEGGKFGTYSNDNGDYELELPLGRHVLVFTAMGYEPIRKEVMPMKNFNWSIMWSCSHRNSCLMMWW